MRTLPELDAEIAILDAEMDQLEEEFKTEWCGTLIFHRMGKLERRLRPLHAQRARVLLAEAITGSGIIFLVSRRPKAPEPERPRIPLPMIPISDSMLTMAADFPAELFNPGRDVAKQYREGSLLS